MIIIMTPTELKLKVIIGKMAPTFDLIPEANQRKNEISRQHFKNRCNDEKEVE